MRSSRAKIALALLVGILSGWGLHVFRAASRVPHADRLAPERRQPSGLRELARQAGEEGLRAPLPSTGPTSALNPSPQVRSEVNDGPGPDEKRTATSLITRALEAYARREIILGWRAARPLSSPGPADELEAMQGFEETVLEGPRQIGMRLASQRNDLDRAESIGPGFALLDQMLKSKSGEAAGEAVRNPEVMDSFFERSISGPMRSGIEYAESTDGLEDGTTLFFPAGVFKLGELAARGKPYPRELTIRGAGMNQTLLFVATVHTRDVLENLAIQDCTVFTQRGPLIDLRREPCSMTFENTRFLGFDSGAGGSSLLDAPAGVFMARRCEFDGSYGRAPGGHATVFDVRSDGLLARFEGCTFRMVNIYARGVRPGARILYAGCRFQDTLDRSPVEESPKMTFQDTTIEYFDRSKGRPTKLDLNELFPDWRARLAQ